MPARPEKSQRKRGDRLGEPQSTAVQGASDGSSGADRLNTRTLAHAAVQSGPRLVYARCIASTA
jgi:hypothetical protein